jgi:tetratricopeptide (TPR) repeat protein
MPTILEALTCALEHQRAGRFPQAEGIYRQVLARDSDNVDALHLLGMVAHQLGQAAQAAELIERAIRLNSSVPAFYNNLGTVYQAQGRPQEAVRCLEQALQLAPDYPEAHVNLGNSLQALHRWEDAVAHYRTALALNPNRAEAHNNLGNALLALECTAEAIPCFQEALRLCPNYPAACVNLGSALKHQDRLEDAAAYCGQALLLDPNLAEAHSNLAAIRLEQERDQEAETHCLRALELKPELAEAQANLSVVRLHRNRLEEAEAAALAALQLKPDLVEGHANLGDVLSKQGRLAEALTCFQTAFELQPRSAEVHNKIGYALQHLGRREEALSWFEEALRLKPDLTDAHVNRALLWLLWGDFARGWPEYEWRWKAKKFSRRTFQQPRWDGAPLPGRTILLHAEQGLGDTLHLIRYAPLVKAAGGTVILECQPRLAPLLSHVSGVDRIIPAGCPPPEYDVQAPLLSLPYIFHTTAATIPAPVPYLQAEPERVSLWAGRIGGEGRYRIGLAWAGNPEHESDRTRSMSLAHFAGLAQVPGTALFSLQRGPRSEQIRTPPQGLEIVNLEEESGDIVDTAAAIQNLDLVISVDSLVGHLAGAMGKPVWLLLPFSPDWRWLLERENSPWYPTARLFRQPRPGDWESVMARVVEALRDAAGS